MEVNEIEVVHQEIKAERLSIKLSLKLIEKVVLKHFGIRSDQLFNRCKKLEFMERKQIFQYLANYYSNCLLIDIGKYGGCNYNHATIIHNIRKIKNSLYLQKEMNIESYVSLNLLETVDCLESKLKKVQLIKMRNTDNLGILQREIIDDILICDKTEEIQEVLKYYIN